MCPEWNQKLLETKFKIVIIRGILKMARVDAYSFRKIGCIFSEGGYPVKSPYNLNYSLIV